MSEHRLDTVGGKTKHGGSRPRSGRKKGTPNKVTKALKDMIQDALHEAGGAAYLVRQAQENPTAFMSLLGRTLPKDLTVDANTSLTVIVETGVPHGKD